MKPLVWTHENLNVIKKHCGKSINFSKNQHSLSVCVGGKMAELMEMWGHVLDGGPDPQEKGQFGC